jgi:hypothetical protein
MPSVVQRVPGGLPRMTMSKRETVKKNRCIHLSQRSQMVKLVDV